MDHGPFGGGAQHLYWGAMPPLPPPAGYGPVTRLYLTVFQANSVHFAFCSDVNRFLLQTI